MMTNREVGGGVTEVPLKPLGLAGLEPHDTDDDDDDAAKLIKLNYYVKCK